MDLAVNETTQGLVAAANMNRMTCPTGSASCERTEKPPMLRSARIMAAWVSRLLMLMRAVTGTRVATLRSGMVTVRERGGC